ncbi:YchJ family metal-binding protein [Flavobacterium sp. NG2]|uniref:YchJ family protein n=1 Tax=Flavobacterium sp. NG2 TaxID=3097547 RepID=UPI002A841C31|nr:YchJ family metal-binding protein [Flavobacterium sp. NG2]WPR70649.1 YchJ family metal-binding protein [Flavobacterium sp. NG2]
MLNTNCYCCSGKTFKNCCEAFLLGNKKAFSAETLMRSRYSAFATHNVDYLIETTHYSTRKNHHKEAILEWATTNQWLQLEVLKASETTVEFKAHYKDNLGQYQIHHEFSTFKKENDNWYYVDGHFLD